MPISMGLGWLDQRLGRLALAGAGTAFVLWLLAVLGRPAPAPLARPVVLAAYLVALAWVARWVSRSWRRDTSGKILVSLVAVALGAAATGLDHELGGLYFADEGVFVAQAQRILDGRPLRGWFIYPHLMFYVDAFALWLAGLFPGATAAVAREAYGVVGELPRAALVCRAATATLSALTVVPVFALARRLAGTEISPTLAAGMAGALAVASPVALEVSRLSIADGPSAFFSALTLAACGRLLDRPKEREFALAGLAAGLAAAAKYPAGTVALAIVALDLRERFRRGRAKPPAAPPWWRLGGVATAGLAAFVVFLAAVPSLIAFPRVAWEGGAGVLFGAKLYAQTAAWVGVVKPSNAAFYAGELLRTFGGVALAAGTLGLLVAPSAVRRRVAWLLPFPVAYTLLLLALKIAVRRSLMPALPALAVVAGVGAAALSARLGGLAAVRRLAPRLRHAGGTALLAALLAAPVARSAVLLARDARPSTREEAAAWIAAHVPPGASFVQEQYTPQLPPGRRYSTRQPRLAIRVPEPDLVGGEYDLLLLASEAYGRFLRPDRAGDPAIAPAAARYRHLFERHPEVARFTPGFWQQGPVIRVLRLDPVPPPAPEQAHLTAAAVADDGMLAAGGGEVVYGEHGQWSLFKTYLAAGRFRLTLAGSAIPSGGEVRAVTRSGEVLAEAALREGTAEIALSRPEKVFLYLDLAPGSRISALTLAPVLPLLD